MPSLLDDRIIISIFLDTSDFLTTLCSGAWPFSAKSTGLPEIFREEKLAKSVVYCARDHSVSAAAHHGFDERLEAGVAAVQFISAGAAEDKMIDTPPMRISSCSAP